MDSDDQFRDSETMSLLQIESISHNLILKDLITMHESLACQTLVQTFIPSRSRNAEIPDSFPGIETVHHVLCNSGKHDQSVSFSLTICGT